MTAQDRKLEQLLRMAAQLTDALEADIAALQAGKPRQMRMITPEMQRLSALFAHEIRNLDQATTKAAPATLRNALRAAIEKMRECTKQHVRQLTRVRNASEGIIKAVAEDIDKKRTALRPYASPKATIRPQPIDPMLFNTMA